MSMARCTPGDRPPPLSPPKERRKAGFFSCNPLGRKGSGGMKIGKNAGITGNSPGKRRKGRVSLKFPVIPALFLILIPSDPHQRNGSAGKIPAFPHPYIPHTPPPPSAVFRQAAPIPETDCAAVTLTEFIPHTPSPAPGAKRQPASRGRGNYSRRSIALQSIWGNKSR